MIVQEIADPLMLSKLIGRMHDPQKRLYGEVLDELRAANFRFGIGGALATGSYTGLFRDTKDLDIYILPENKEEIVALLMKLGWSDYFKIASYDRSWIFRGCKEDDTIVDVIFGMANQPNSRVTIEWLDRALLFELNGVPVPVLSPEELIRAKIFVFQRLRCDWPDLLNLVYCVGRSIDWNYLIDKLGENAPLLGSVLILFCWLCPGEAAFLPPDLWEKVGVQAPHYQECDASIIGRRIYRLDSRPWFVAQSDTKGGTE